MNQADDRAASSLHSAHARARAHLFQLSIYIQTYNVPTVDRGFDDWMQTSSKHTVNRFNERVNDASLDRSRESYLTEDTVVERPRRSRAEQYMR